jgi:hypothetical protein
VSLDSVAMSGDIRKGNIAALKIQFYFGPA